jgi:hypothetical protein
MRSRNVEFVAQRLKPFTRVYSFFNGIDVNNFIVPKLLEIQMSTGVFEVGETVEGIVDIPANFSSLTISPVRPYPKITFRVANSNHKYGPFNAPTQVFNANPYEVSQPVPEFYSSTSTILNVDTFSLSLQAQGDYFGYVDVGMKLRGLTSGAEAVITNLRLITDKIGVVIGSFYIPNPNVFGNPRFETGPKLFRITNSSTNSTIEPALTSAEERYFSEGKVNKVQENILSVRTVRTETQTVIESRPESITGPTAVVATTIVGNTLPPIVPLSPPPPVVPEDPEEEIDFEQEIPEPTFPEPIETPSFDFPSPEPFIPDFGGGDDFPLPPLPEIPEPPDPEIPEGPDDPGTGGTGPGKKRRGSKKKGGKNTGKRFINVVGLDGRPGNSKGPARTFRQSIAVNLVNGKTFFETKAQIGAKKARQKFKNAGQKITKTDRGINVPVGRGSSVIASRTKKPKFNLPNVNVPSQRKLATQQVRDKLLTPRQVGAPRGNLITNNRRTPTQPQPNRGRSNNNNNARRRR